MFREIITVNEPVYQLKLPEELRGKKIEILAFEIETYKSGDKKDKAGFAERTDRIAKYNQLIRIEEELGNTGIFLGKGKIKFGK